MLSGIGPADHLKSVGIKPVHDLPGVGVEPAGPSRPLRHRRMHRRPHLRQLRQAAPLGLGRPAISAVQEGAGGVQPLRDRRLLVRRPDRRSPDIQFHLGLGSGIEAGVEKLKNPGVTLNSAFLRPRSRGSVRLASADPAAAPLIDPNYWADPYDREMSIKGLRIAREIMRQNALKPFVDARGAARPVAGDRRRAVRLCLPQRQDRPPSGRHLPHGPRRRWRW